MDGAGSSSPGVEGVGGGNQQKRKVLPPHLRPKKFQQDALEAEIGGGGDTRQAEVSASQVGGDGGEKQRFGDLSCPTRITSIVEGSTGDEAVNVCDRKHDSDTQSEAAETGQLLMQYSWRSAAGSTPRYGEDVINIKVAVDRSAGQKILVDTMDRFKDRGLVVVLDNAAVKKALEKALTEDAATMMNSLPYKDVSVAPASGATAVASAAKSFAEFEKEAPEPTNDMKPDCNDDSHVGKGEKITSKLDGNSESARICEERKHRCQHCNRMVLHNEKSCWENPANQRTLNAFKGQATGTTRRTAMAAADSDDIGEITEKSKEKVNVAMTALGGQTKLVNNSSTTQNYAYKRHYAVGETIPLLRLKRESMARDKQRLQEEALKAKLKTGTSTSPSTRAPTVDSAQSSVHHEAEPIPRESPSITPTSAYPSAASTTTLPSASRSAETTATSADVERGPSINPAAVPLSVQTKKVKIKQRTWFTKPVKRTYGTSNQTHRDYLTGEREIEGNCAFDLLTDQAEIVDTTAGHLKLAASGATLAGNSCTGVHNVLNYLADPDTDVCPVASCNQPCSCKLLKSCFDEGCNGEYRSIRGPCVLAMESLGCEKDKCHLDHDLKWSGLYDSGRSAAHAESLGVEKNDENV